MFLSISKKLGDLTFEITLVRTKNFAVVGNCVANCMLSHNNVQ